MSKFDSYANNVERQINIGGGFAGSLPVDSRRFSQVSISTGGTFTSANDLGFFTRVWQEPRYKITGEVINVKCRT